MTKRRILFVDDEPDVLSALRRSLRKLRHEWDMAFAESGVAALHLFEETPFDVIVTDMRMPGMDGAELLKEVARKYPGTIRIILSGYSDQDTVMRTVSVAHQYLAKPCEVELLKEVIEQASVLRGTIYNKQVEEVVSGMKTIPSCPSLYLQIIEALEVPDVSLRRVGDIIEQDVGMTAKILQLVNSAFFGLSRNVTSIFDAVRILGLETIRTLVLMVGVFRAFEHVQVPGLGLRKLWEHAIMVGKCARNLARRASVAQTLGDTVYLGGMLHDVGKFVMAAALPESFAKALDTAMETNRPLYDVEWEVFQTTHAEVGAYLMGIWGLPDDIVTAIAFHHEPARSRIGRLSPLVFVHVANAFTHILVKGQKGQEGLGLLDRDFLSRVGVWDRLLEWKKACEESWEQGGSDET